MSPSTSCAGDGSSGICPATKSRFAGANGLRVRAPPGGWGRVSGVETGVCSSIETSYAALTTLFDRRQRVQTRMRLTPPLIIARTVCRFGSNRRALTLCAWLS